MSYFPKKNFFKLKTILLSPRSLRSAAVSSKIYEKAYSQNFAKLQNGPNLKDFLNETSENNMISHAQCFKDDTPYLNHTNLEAKGKKVFLEVYGCQMNVNDTEIVLSILNKTGYTKTDSLLEADILLIMTCAIREGAEFKIWERLRSLKSLRKKGKTKKELKFGILGCMAERLKEKIIEKEKSVDLVAGPDSYKDLPRLLSLTDDHQTAINVQLSIDETYADVTPIRLSKNSVSAYVSIMRGCDNMCSYCIVPFTRGRERSRPLDSILSEVRLLSDQGIKEITLLGQNVNSYRDTSVTHYTMSPTRLVPGFKTVYKPKLGGLRFAELLDKVSEIDPEIRIRFTSPHPKDFPDEVLEVIANRANIAKCLHLPAQSGSSAVLERMRRGYTRETYLDLVERVRKVLPNVALTSDFICGFCGETEEEFKETLKLMEDVGFSGAFMFAYSMREKTTAHRRLEDDVPLQEKKKRVQRLVEAFRKSAKKVNEAQIGETQLILIEGDSKRSENYLAGRNDGNVKVIVPKDAIPIHPNSSHLLNVQPGDYITVLINAATSQVLKGIPLYHSSISQFSQPLPGSFPFTPSMIDQYP